MGMDETGVFEEYRVLDAELVSHAADGAVVDLNGTQVMFKQNPHAPVLVEIFVGDESKPIGSINIAKGCTVTLGGVEEGLAKKVDALNDVTVDELPDNLDELAYRLNPEGREEPSI